VGWDSLWALVEAADKNHNRFIDEKKIIGRLKPGTFTVKQVSPTDFVMLDTENHKEIKIKMQTDANGKVSFDGLP